MTSVACRSVVQSFQGLYPVYSLQTAITHTHTIGVVNSRSHMITHMIPMACDGSDFALSLERLLCHVSRQ